MTSIVVGISDCRVSNEPESTIVTYGLGSCIAVIAYDPLRKIGGMLHYMLPESSLDPKKAAGNPCMFADTGIPLLFDQVRACGADPRKMSVRLVGGAQVLDPANVFGIGRRNYLAAKKILWKLGAFISHEAVGGELSRTVRLDVGTGRSWLREGSKPENELGSGQAGQQAPAREAGKIDLSAFTAGKLNPGRQPVAAQPKGGKLCPCGY